MSKNTDCLSMIITSRVPVSLLQTNNIEAVIESG